MKGFISRRALAERRISFTVDDHALLRLTLAQAYDMLRERDTYEMEVRATTPAAHGNKLEVQPAEDEAPPAADQEDGR